MISPEMIRRFRETLAEVLRQRLQIASHANIAAYETSVGHPGQEGNRFYDTTAKRVRIFTGGAWRILGGS